MKKVLVLVDLCFVTVTLGQFEWQTRDSFDEIKRKFESINAENCFIKHDTEVFLPDDVVSHKPDIKDININPVFPNRTALLHLHNVALSRSFFWSYILQSRFIRPAINDTYDPGMMYYFLSTVADVSSSSLINASSIYFSPNSSYSSSYRGFFNKTFPRFAPRTFRFDDFNDPIYLLKTSTMNTFSVTDLGAISKESYSKDFTSDLYRINEWYKKWLPDNVENRHDTKTTYQVEIRYANNTNETFTFHGPPGADENPGPVKWTRPYFDCGRSNKWLVAAVVPIADIYPRHTQFRHIEYPKYTAVSVLEMDFERVDINQCPKGEGNNGPNKFVDTARCKKETTECEPLNGWGFRRGGYQCRCKPGFRLPNVVRRPFLGEIIERASSEQYYDAFDCLRIGWLQKLPIQWERAPYHLRQNYLDQHHEYLNFSTGSKSLHQQRLNIDEVLKFIHSVNYRTCKNFHPHDLILRGDVAFGAKNQFENEAKMAVRLANFLSAFLQISDPNEIYSGTRVPDKALTEDQMFGEILALVLGNARIWSSGMYWDRNKFSNRTYFAPFAYKKYLNTRKYKVEDLARSDSTKIYYTEKQSFRFLKQRWSTNLDGLETFYLKIKMRYNESGELQQKFEHYPTKYRAANLNHGHWLQPKFDCGGFVPKWIISYAVPFFGWDQLKARLEFKGIVTVSMDMMQLDINQCPDDVYVPNAYKNSHKCDRRTSYCVPLLGRGYETGGYKCECLQGYEYPFEDPITYYDGQLVEAEFKNIVENKETRFDLFKCRLASAPAIFTPLSLLKSMLVVLLVHII